MNYLDYSFVKTGYAFQPDHAERAKAIRERYAQIMDDLKKKAKMHTEYFRGRNVVVYENHDELLKEYTRVDLLIFADDGNLCFGGCYEGNRYTYFTD